MGREMGRHDTSRCTSFDRSRTEILCLTNYVWRMFGSVSVLEPRRWQ
ncbi:hypothetical protein APHMUC_0076 [Anaplasma phagocytophilum str. ApMUC09]|uniref:Uncharacterized protein n=1 Tax=Anaplasma phagocytophilum str. ApMUC09 TaxID=1359152 RepID=A0A0F3N9Y2_ANAPH|nr:hypothetical protein APHMUC_0076 [Anaplasma phagocytophilum str. ApMUC09]